MPDDDLDLDLEIEAEAARPKRRGLFGRRKKETTPAEAQTSPEGETPPAKKRGFFARFAPSGDAAPGKASFLNIKNFLIGLVALIVLVLVVQNWSPARLYFIGLHMDIPKSILLVVVFALGFGIAWWICHRRGAGQTSK